MWKYVMFSKILEYPQESHSLHLWEETNNTVQELEIVAPIFFVKFWVFMFPQPGANFIELMKHNN